MIGEVAYVFLLVPTVAWNRSKFSPKYSSIIDSAVFGILVIAIDGAIMHVGVPGIHTNQIGEWIAFFFDFFVRF